MLRNALLAAVAVLGLSVGSANASGFFNTQTYNLGTYTESTGTASAGAATLGGVGLTSTLAGTAVVEDGALAGGKAVAGSLNGDLGWNGSSTQTEGVASVEASTDVEYGDRTKVVKNWFWVKPYSVKTVDTPVGSAGNTVTADGSYLAGAGGEGGPSASFAGGLTKVGAISYATPQGGASLAGGFAGAIAGNVTVGSGLVTSGAFATATVATTSSNR